MSEDQFAYFTRAFRRLRAEAVSSLHQTRLRITSEEVHRGLSGNLLDRVGRDYERVAADAIEKMVRLAYELTGSTSPPVLEALEEGMSLLRNALSDDLAEFFRSSCAWAPSNAVEFVGNRFSAMVDGRVSATVDDYRHGLLGGVRLTKDPLVNLISSISNSPGAVLQSGIGNSQQAITSGGVDAIRTALDDFLKSNEVRGLPLDDKVGIEDMAEVITTELGKPTPDPTKLKRWGRRLLDIAERLGIAMAASGFGHAMFGGG
jgi:hypothetical protein